ncbi:MAG: SCP2 sterol-binding domain-containing protein [Acidimicrobiia bacterium]|nr:SCP2 sterol-binding domain-containing protein [Acidimicrobiia bacterium]
MVDQLSEAWVAAVAEASQHRTGTSGTVAIAIGKSKQAVLDIVEGRVVGSADPERADVTIPVTQSQLDAIVGGDESLAQAFMRGDVKPEGATGSLIAAVELFEDEEFRRKLIELL